MVLYVQHQGGTDSCCYLSQLQNLYRRALIDVFELGIHPSINEGVGWLEVGITFALA